MNNIYCEHLFYVVQLNSGCYSKYELGDGEMEDEIRKIYELIKSSKDEEKIKSFLTELENLIKNFT